MNLFNYRRGESPLLLSMPHSGTELPPELAERLVFLTGGALTARVLNFISMSNRPILAKPFTHEEIMDAVQSYGPRRELTVSSSCDS